MWLYDRRSWARAMPRAVRGWLLVAICCSGCLGRPPLNADCAWPDEPVARLDLRAMRDRRHLSADARVAEELAIRHADAARGHRSGHYAGADEYHGRREQCLAALSVEIARHHSIEPARVAGAVGQRDAVLDAVVLLIFAVLFGIAANGFTRQLFIRLPPDEPWPALIGAAAGAIAVSATGVIAGGLAASIVEMIQVGNMHMSYRADRMPWARHWLSLFAGGLILFSLIAIARWRHASSPPSVSRRTPPLKQK
jgi:hypothetical protein